MKAFLAMLAASINMLRRNTALLVTSLGLALISIFVFGWLFGGNASPRLELGVVDEDHSAISAQMLDGLRKSDSLDVAAGARTGELLSLREGHRSAVLVIPAGFGQQLAQGHTTLQVYYDQSSTVIAANTRMAVQSIVTGLNSQITNRPSPVTLQEQAVSVRNLRQIDWLTPGMLGMLLMWANLTVGVVLVEWRQQGI